MACRQVNKFVIGQCLTGESVRYASACFESAVLAAMQQQAVLLCTKRIGLLSQLTCNKLAQLYALIRPKYYTRDVDHTASVEMTWSDQGPMHRHQDDRGTISQAISACDTDD